MASPTWRVTVEGWSWEWRCVNPWTAIYRTFKYGADEGDELAFVDDSGRWTGPDSFSVRVDLVEDPRRDRPPVCGGNFRRHRFGDDGLCMRCGVSKFTQE